VELAKVGRDGNAFEVLGGASNENKIVRASVVGYCARFGTICPVGGFNVGTNGVGLEGVARFARFWTVLVDGLFPGAEPGLFVRGT